VTLARIKFAYIGGGSTRAPGAVASFIAQGENFEGSEIVLIDLNAERLSIVKRIGEKMARARGLDLTFTASTERRDALTDCDAVLTSFRVGGFEARHIDESVPLKFGVIGQETQGPGGFFMALRTIAVMKEIVRDMEAGCPNAWLFNYTNPVNIVAEAVTHHSDLKTMSLCEGPIIFPRMLARAADLDPDQVEAAMIGLNHASWTIRHQYAGEDMIPLVQAAYERKREDPAADPHRLQLLAIAATMESLPADYFRYYYFRDEILAELRVKRTTRAQDIMAAVPDNWAHYAEVAVAEDPVLDPQRSRGGVNELELAVDVTDALFNDRGEVWPVNVTNGGSIRNLPDDLVVETEGFVSRQGVIPLAGGDLPRRVVGLVQMLGEYQALTARAAWEGTRRDAIQALAGNPLVLSPGKAEAIYDAMSTALRQYLPDRLMA
jgi:6-phospho-beta-glucosidase